MIPYYPAVYIGPNGEQFPVGYHPPPMALPYEQHQQQQHASPQNSRQYRPTAHQHQHQHHPQHHPRAQQHALHQHSQQQHSQHFQGHQNGPFPIHGPTSTPLSFVGTTIKPTSFSGQSTLESISTPNMHQLKSSASLGSIGSSSSGSSGDKGDSEGGDTFNSHEDSSSTNLSPAVSLPALRAPAPDYPSPAQPSAKTSFPSSLTAAACTGSQQTQTSHHSNPPSSSASSAMGTISPAAVADTGTQGNAAVSDTGKASAHMTPATAGGGSGNENYPSTTDPAANTYETAAVQGQQAEEEVVGERDGLQEQPKQQEAVSPPSSSQHQHQQQQQHLQQPFGQYPSPYSAPHSVGPHSGSHQSPYPQPSHRSAPASPYYPSRQNPNHSKPLSGQQGQGPGIHGAMALPQGPAPSQQAYGAPPPFFGPTVPPMPPSPGSRRTAVYPGQAPVPPGSHPFSMPTGGRPGQQFHSPSGYKQPFTNQGYPQDFQHSGYYATPEGWHQIPTPALQKKPKELDKAMWVGNVLNDTTLAELQAIFEAEPTEAEGDIQHDIPESIFILSKSNCAFVNYSSHEAVDRAVQRFHDREFKNTRLVCRPRKDPGSDPYSNKIASLGRFQHQQRHPQHQQQHEQPPYIPDSMGYYGSDQPLLTQRLETGDSHRDISEVQSRMERMRLEGGSPMLDSSSSGGEGSTLGPSQHKERGSSKKSRSTTSLEYAESRFFILKSLNEEDLKLSVQYGIWATQDHLVPILNEAFSNTKNVYLVFSANKSGEFFGYARMLDHISTENERAITTGRENEIWQPATEDLPLSPEMKAAMLAEIEQAAKEGRQITNEEAAVIARNSTTTKSWGIRFPIQWMHVHKVPFSKTTHMLNPLYENREIKVSKDGTEVDPAIGERLLELFKKPNCSNRRGRSSVSGQGSRSDSDGSRRSSVAEELSSLAPPQSHRSASSRRSSIMSTRSAGSGGGDRRTSIDPSRAPGSSYKNTHSSMHMTNRGHFSGDVNQPYSGAGGYRGSPRHGHFGSHSSHGSNTSQGPFAADQYPDQQRSGWGNKPNYRGGGPGGYGTSSMSGAGMQGGFYQQDHSPNHRKGGSGGPGGKYGSSYHPSSQHGGYENPPFHLPHAPRRHTGLQHHSYPGSYRPNMSSPAADPSLGGNSGYKHDVGGAPPGSGGPAGQQDQSYSGRSRGGPIPPGAHIPPNQLGGQPILTHPGVYNGQGPPVGYPAPFPPPGYPMMPPYMGYPYVPGPNPFIHGTIAWHPGQGPPMPAGMISGAGMVTGHPTSMPMIPGAGGEGGHGMEGMVPLFGYDGVAYGYVPAEEAYHQSMTGYGYMSHDPHASEQADVEAHINSDEELTGTGSKGNDQGADDAGVTTENVEEGSESHDQRGRQAQSQSFTDSAKHDTEDRQQDYASTSAASDQATSGAGDDVVGKEER